MNNSGITGIILAGGKSSRMGKDKGWVLFRKKPLIDYAVELLGGICQSIVISANNSAYDKLGLPVYHDIIPDSGPMGGIYTCLKTFFYQTKFSPCLRYAIRFGRSSELFNQPFQRFYGCNTPNIRRKLRTFVRVLPQGDG